MNRQTGFTLIELMITVAIIAILASIAYPSYTSYVRRGKITDAHAALADYRIKLEQYYQDNRNYGTAGGTCGATAPTATYFTLSCTAGNPAQTYTATAASNTGQGLGDSAGDYTYTIDEANNRSTTKFAGAALSPAKSCWLVRGDEC